MINIFFKNFLVVSEAWRVALSANSIRGVRIEDLGGWGLGGALPRPVYFYRLCLCVFFRSLN